MERLIEIILDYVEPDEEITAETNLKNGLGMSSFDLVCLAEDIHNEFGVELTVDVFRDCNTVGELAKYILGE